MRAFSIRSLCIAAVLFSLADVAAAGGAAQGFELDVVSVREGGSGLALMSFQPGRMVWPNVSLETLVRFVFGVPMPFGFARASDQQVEGWPNRDLPARRFTLEATYSGAGTLSPPEQRRIVRAILEDRFGMRVRIEQREWPVYALRLVEPGVLGPGLRQVEYDCTDEETRLTRREDCRGDDSNEERGMVYRGSGPIAALAVRLHLDLPDRVIVDRSGLDGFYSWELLRTERLVQRQIMRPLQDLLPVQLGLTLEETRAPVEVVVIDAISMPTPN